METEPNGAVPNPILKEWGAGYDLDSYPGGVNFDGVPEFVEKVEAAAADESALVPKSYRAIHAIRRAPPIHWLIPQVHAGAHRARLRDSR